MLTTIERLTEALEAAGQSAPDDEVLTRQIEAATRTIEGFCRRSFAPATITEYHPPDMRVTLSHPPVRVLTAPASGYGIENAEAGIVRRRGGSYLALYDPLVNYHPDAYPGDAVFTYEGGYLNVPADLEQICIDLIMHAESMKAVDTTITSERMEDWSQTYNYDTRSVPAPFQSRLMRYRL